MKTLIASISIVVLSVLSTVASAATVEHVCEPEEGIRASSEYGMTIKTSNTDVKSILLVARADNTGDIFTSYELQDPSVSSDYSVRRTRGSIRWTRTSDAALEVYTLFTKSMRMTVITTLQTGSDAIDGTSLRTYTCRRKL